MSPDRRLAANEVVGSNLGRQHPLQPLARQGDFLGHRRNPLDARDHAQRSQQRRRIASHGVFGKALVEKRLDLLGMLGKEINDVSLQQKHVNMGSEDIFIQSQASHNESGGLYCKLGRSMSLRKLIPRAPIQQSSIPLFMHTTPLLKEERYTP